ncbi:MAG: hypothetical protein HYU56_01340 [Candidatus Aenigmarchaeota archaeon]|nr:hypothetical protein [Candidatus Aenigmarchaeota archaeon]
MPGRPKKLDTNASGRTEGGLVGTRYGMPEMSKLMDDRFAITSTMLEVEGIVPYAISRRYPRLVPPEHAGRIQDVAYRIRAGGMDDFLGRVAEREAVTHHLEDSIFETLREEVGEAARPYVHIFLTSADSSETAKYLLLKKGLGILIRGTEELRDTCLGVATEWLKQGHLHMASTHGADALPEYLGRRLATEAYMLDSNANRLFYDSDNHVVGTLSGATGNFHPMRAAGIDGRLIEQECCGIWGLTPSVSLQDPPREHLAYIFADLAISGRTVANVLKWVKYLKNTARGELREEPDEGTIGSSAMPHKEGNPSVEERTVGLSYGLHGNFTAILETTSREDARHLEGSALDRIKIPESFIMLDYGNALAANVLLRVEPQPEKLKAGIWRTLGAPTSERIRYALINKGMPEKKARTLSGKLAREAMKSGRKYAHSLLEDPEVTRYLSREQIDEFANPENYTGDSKRIIEQAHEELFGKRLLAQ